MGAFLVPWREGGQALKSGREQGEWAWGCHGHRQWVLALPLPVPPGSSACWAQCSAWQAHVHAGFSTVHVRLVCSAVHGGLICSADSVVDGLFQKTSEKPKCISRGYSESGRDGVVLASFLAAPVESRCCKWQWLPCHMT